jgi:hypothetical protein
MKQFVKFTLVFLLFGVIIAAGTWVALFNLSRILGAETPVPKLHWTSERLVIRTGAWAETIGWRPPFRVQRTANGWQISGAPGTLSVTNPPNLNVSWQSRPKRRRSNVRGEY